MAKAKFEGHLAHYATALTNWSKLWGTPITAAQAETAHGLGCRPGKQALARALELRPEGATDGIIKAVCIAQWGNSGSHNNKRSELETAGYIKRVPTMHSPQGHMVYKIALTPKGEAVVKARATGTVVAPVAKAPVKATPAKAPKASKAPAKAKGAPKAKAPATPTPAAETAPVVTGEPMTAIAPLAVPTADQPQVS